MNEPSLSSAESGYLFDNRASEAGQRFDSLSALFNPVTFRHLECARHRHGVALMFGSVSS